MQARYVCSLIAGKVPCPLKIEELHQADRLARATRYQKVNMDAVYPVEMFPYCDKLSETMKATPSLFSVGSLLLWCRMQLAPATTLHYVHRDLEARERCQSAPIYMPTSLVLLLLMLKPLDVFYRTWRWLRQRLFGKRI